MEAIPWFWVWVIIAAVLAIGEMLTLSFFMLPFAVGAVIAALLNALGLDLAWQVIVFIVVSGVSLLAMRPLAKRLTRKGGNVKVGAERLVGMQGKVVEGQSDAGQFRVLVDREPWNAATEDCTRLDVGMNVEVLAIDSNSLIVKKLPEQTDPC